jgi:HK97 gp10 family phage protein
MPKYTKEAFYSSIAAFDARLKRALLHGAWAMRDAARELAKLGEVEVRASIDKTGSYKPYWKKGKKRMSSAPGTPPAAQRGETLEPSIYSKVVSSVKRNPAEAEFGSTASFARDLEFGTEDMQPRPFLRPAKAKVRAAARPIVVGFFEKALVDHLTRSKLTTVKYDMEA